MSQKKIAIIGCGNLGLSILNGLLDNNTYQPNEITITKRKTETLTPYKNKGVNVTTDNSLAIAQSDVIIVALKPYNILELLKMHQSSFNPKKHIVVSLATGVSLSQLQDAIGDHVPVYRAMPNTAADVRESLTCLATKNTIPENVELVENCFGTIGETILIDESLMDAATVLGACGIAYVLRFMRGMIQGGIQIGFDAKTATKIVTQTVKGASELLITNKQHPEFEIDKVTTPKGCTIAGLNEMEHHGFSSALIKGIVTSYHQIQNNK